MEYLPKHAVLPQSPRTQERVERAAQTLASRMRGLRLAELDISDYNKRYLGTYLKDLDAVLQRYSFILAWALAPGDQKGDGPNVVLDYGGGSGCLSLLARAAGVPTVLYNDIFDGSCRDAAVIAKALDLSADQYIHGEIDEVLAYIRPRNISIDTVTNNDVLEHIYDVETFLRRLPELSRNGLNVSLATGANDQNLYVRRRLQRLQREREYQDRTRQYGHKDGETSASYRAVRASVVRSHAPSLSESEVQRLADATRGMVRADVIRTVDAYRNTGTVPPSPEHPTNTCDPETGSWAEHLMSPRWLRSVMEQAGFRARSIPGPYGFRVHPAKHTVARVLDLAITGLKDRGLVLSPYLLMQGVRSSVS